jgi:hypothetical protein
MQTQIQNLIYNYSTCPSRLKTELNKLGYRYNVVRKNILVKYVVRLKNSSDVFITVKL